MGNVLVANSARTSQRARLLAQARLPDPGLTGNHDQPPRAADRLLQKARDRSQLINPAEEAQAPLRVHPTSLPYRVAPHVPKGARQ